MKSTILNGPIEPYPSCPECRSLRIWKDGLRYPRSNKNGRSKPVQRYLCAACGYRFSEKSNKESHDEFRAFEPVQKIHRMNLKTVNRLSFNRPGNGCGRENPWLRGGTEPQMKRIAGEYQGTRVTTTLKAKNLATTAKTQKRAAGAAEPDPATMKGKIVEFLWHLKKNGRAEDTIRTRKYLLQTLVNFGANLFDPESVKDAIAKYPN